MFETIFGAEMPLALRFFIAFLVVLGLIGLTAWVVRRFGADRFGNATIRGRAPRLAVIDAAAVDSRRRLIIVRRDNVEHLLMIGGPSDVVVETNIVRGAGAQRDSGLARSGTDSLPRAVPLSDGAWQGPDQAAQDIAQWPQQAPATRPSPRAADTIAGLAAEFSTRPAMPTDLDKGAPASTRNPAPAEQMRTPSSTPPLAPDAPYAASGDQNLVEMAQRLEQALRRPGTPGAAAPQGGSPQGSPSQGAGAQAAEPAPASRAAPADRKPSAAPADAKPGPAKSMYDSLEQEMASLLGRPKNQT